MLFSSVLSAQKIFNDENITGVRDKSSDWAADMPRKSMGF